MRVKSHANGAFAVFIAAADCCDYNAHMSILLFSDGATCGRTLPALATRAGDHVLLCAGDGDLASTPLSQEIAAAIPDLQVVDVNSGRFRRLNYDLLASIIVDLDVETLLSSPGRRLIEMLGNLASLDDGAGEMALGFVGSATGAAGGMLLDGVHAGLGLVPGTAIAPNLAEVKDLRALLKHISAGLGRLIALEAPVGVAYAPRSDQLTVADSGSALLVAFVRTEDEKGSDGEPTPPTARLHVVTGGMVSGFPDA